MRDELGRYRQSIEELRIPVVIGNFEAGGCTVTDDNDTIVNAAMELGQKRFSIGRRCRPELGEGAESLP
jgi:hypothetical protein